MATKPADPVEALMLECRAAFAGVDDARRKAAADALTKVGYSIVIGPPTLEGGGSEIRIYRGAYTAPTLRKFIKPESVRGKPRGAAEVALKGEARGALDVLKASDVGRLEDTFGPGAVSQIGGGA